MHGQAGRRREAMATASPRWSPWPWVTRSRSQAVTLSARARAARVAEPRVDEDGPATGRRDLDAGVAVPGDRRAGGSAIVYLLRPSDASARLHSARVVRADRPEPGLHQLDGADRTGPRLVRRGRAPAPPVGGDRRVPGLHHGLRHRLRHPGLAERRRPAGDPGGFAGGRRSRPGTARAAPPSAAFVVLVLAGLVARRAAPAPRTAPGARRRSPPAS